MHLKVPKTEDVQKAENSRDKFKLYMEIKLVGRDMLVGFKTARGNEIKEISRMGTIRKFIIQRHIRR